ncbi:hypothetical protein D5R81_19105 [Parashewanella spongiae]|uniref:OmpA-like domain-containing protein n=1 Tax=Parashewanella spongiae TaxID=342950 RepID=A0A3A6TJA6_9GAMM|nr:OmpA family protein [Parashewanella spongiae]MCL1080166.1 OmpA family protein [Parashewanella spongiae]RJY04868.1 hypothetical protein D5R81_19105 [Parashewanella spongiae]
MECRDNHILPNSTRVLKLQTGYASVLFLAVFAAIALAVFSLYDTGIVASERIRMQNTADNVAYSTTNMVTRDMNIIAITNRAMVANQVAIGQIVALDVEREPRLVIDYVETRPIDIKQSNKSLPLSLTFKNGSSEISEINVITLDKVADVIKNNTETKYIVTGHTDSIGSNELNEQLSIERADAIKNYLVDKHDIAPDLILSKGVGAVSPKKNNGTMLGRSANRRAEVTRL